MLGWGVSFDLQEFSLHHFKNKFLQDCENISFYCKVYELTGVSCSQAISRLFYLDIHRYTK